MQQSAQTQPSPTTSSFAGLLAALALPSRDAADRDPASSGSDVGEDVETLSYERALRAHARYKPVDRSDWPQTPTTETNKAHVKELLAEEPAGRTVPVQAGAAKEAADRDLRQASVTIRLSKTEYARLHERAAEAGVTVSAYLRSCTFEAEALRAQVKEALAELRSGAEVGSKRARVQESNGPGQRSNPEIKLARVLGHIGHLWIGLSSGKAS
jgi:hypothetical protein